jgi:hypothetical protein
MKFGLIQEVSVDFKGDLKKLYAQQQFPVSTARGKMDVAIKGKLAVQDMNLFNQMFFAQAQSAGYNQVVDGEQHTISATSQVVTNIPVVQDLGVAYVKTAAGVVSGQQFIRDSTNVAATVTAAGHYCGPNLTSGSYALNAADNGAILAFSYTYSQNTVGSSIALAGQLMGFAPELSMLFYNRFRNKFLAIQLNDVTLGTISFPSKLEDFWVSDIEGSANLDAAGNLGVLMGDLN